MDRGLDLQQDYSIAAQFLDLLRRRGRFDEQVLVMLQEERGHWLLDLGCDYSEVEIGAFVPSMPGALL
jgi:hypothetical protein